MASGIVMKKSQILPPLLKWVPVKKWFFYKEEGESEEDTTFRMLEAFGMEMIGFVGLIQLILCIYLLVDLILTWRCPVRYLSIQG